MKKLKQSLIVMITVLLLVACGGGGKTDGVKEVSLALWDENQAPIIQESIDKFNELHDGEIKVTVNLVPWSDYWTKLDASLESSESSDVIWMNVYLKKYVDGGTLLPLDDFVKEESFDLGQYVDGRVDSFKENGKLYALPKGSDSVYVALNKEIFEKHGVDLPKAGWTWDDMELIAGQLKAAIDSSNTGEYPITMELDAQPSFLNFIYQNGGEYLNDDKTETKIGEQPAVDAIQKMIDLMDGGLMAPYTVLSETKATDLFVSGKSGIVFIGSWKASVLEESALAKAGNVELIEMPKMAEHNHAVGGGLGYSISKNTKHPEAAWEFVKYITGEESMTNEAQKGIDFPALIAAQPAYVSSFSNIDGQVIVDAALKSFPYPSNGDFTWTTVVNDAIALALSGEAKASEVLPKAQEEANKIIAELK